MPQANADASALLAFSAGRVAQPGSPSRCEAGAAPPADETTASELDAGDILPGRPAPCGCPRCGASASDTKFCYYNNYNVKQPRFFCKSCQRYWTAGGTLRNVQPGAGRRKRADAPAEDTPALPPSARPPPRDGVDTGSGTEPEDSGQQRSTRRRSLRTRRTPGDGATRTTASAGDGATSRGAASVGGVAPVGQRQSRSQGGKGMSSPPLRGLASPVRSNATSLWLPAVDVFPPADAMPWAVAATMAALNQHSAGGGVVAAVPTAAHSLASTQKPFMWPTSMDPSACAAAAALWPYTRLAMQPSQHPAVAGRSMAGTSSLCLPRPKPCTTAAPPSYLSALGLDALPLGKGLFAPQPSLVANPVAFARSVMVQGQAAAAAAAVVPDAAAATAAA